VTTVDQIVEQQLTTPVGFIKIDVEGMEGDVVRGAKSTITNHRPIIYYEASMAYEALRGQKYLLEVQSFLQSLDYRIGTWSHGHFTDKLYPYTHDNLLAVPREHTTGSL
jgi:Methyltransferase FkbM domain